MEESTSELELPGFRFHPTEEELLGFYLKNMVFGKKLHFDIIGFLNIYHHDPSDLPGLAKIGEREWYFFVPRDRRHGNGGRPNRTTETGFWKATGSDRKILSHSDPKRLIGLKKTLVFYKGRAPRGCKTDWVMNEYRLPDNFPAPKEIVLCKIYRKATSLKVLEQRAAMEGEMKGFGGLEQSPPMTPPTDTISFSGPQEESMEMAAQFMAFKREDTEDDYNAFFVQDNAISTSTTSGKAKLSELQVPRFGMDWPQDPVWAQPRSPWLDNFTMPQPQANVMNF